MTDRLHDACSFRPPRFLLGTIVISEAASEAMDEAWVSLGELISRHQYGDWGDVSPEARSSNEVACRDENDVISAYSLCTGQLVWIATDSGRRFTALTLASEQQ